MDPNEIAHAALRVLTAIQDRQRPEAEDVRRLQEFAPALRDLPEDELACEVIQSSLLRGPGRDGDSPRQARIG
jgi:hypothetical protein